MKQKENDALWPSVATIPGARRALMYGVVAAALEALFSLAVAVDPLIPGATASTGVDMWSLAASIVVGALALGIYKGSRAAAVAALLLFIGSRAFLIPTAPKVSFLTVVLILVLMVCYVHALRGTFALHDLRRVNETDT
jgi:hypothetical protein